MGPSGDPGERLRAARLAELDHWSRTNPYGMAQGLDVRFLLGRIAELERERDAARLAAAEAGIVLEALWLAEHDGWALSPLLLHEIELVLPKLRAALRADGA